MSQKILVIGATGNVGSGLVELLTEQGEQIKAATRTPDAYPTRSNVEAVAFDFDDVSTYTSALAGVDRMFFHSLPGDPTPQQKLNPFIDRAKAVGVQHLVLMTAMGVDQAPDEVGLRQVEKHVIASGSAYTILRPNWFMQNFSHGFLLPSIKEKGGIYLPAEDAKTSFIDTRDISAVAAAALTEEGHRGQEYTLTGAQALSYQEAAEVLSKASGRHVSYTAISEDDMRQALSAAGWGAEQVDFMLGLFATVRQGWAAAISPAVSSVLGRDPISLEQFSQDYAEVWQ